MRNNLKSCLDGGVVPWEIFDVVSWDMYICTLSGQDQHVYFLEIRRTCVVRSVISLNVFLCYI